MILTLLALLTILYLALQLEQYARLPSPLGLIALSFGFHALFAEHFVFIDDMQSFSNLVLLLLPILLIYDSMQLRIADLKKHGLSLAYLAIVAVALSVLTAMLLGNTLFAEYHLSTAAIIVLFAMVLATDPVSVVSIFSKFKLPHQLKILCEGESLFNDATALIVFVFIGLYALEGGEISAAYITEISLLVIFGSSILGLVFGYLGLILLKTTTHRTAEMLIILMIGYGSFELAEHFYTVLNMLGMHSHMHLSGILSCIFAIITLNHVMINEQSAHEQIEKTTNIMQSAVQKIKANIEEKQRHLRTTEDIQLLSLIANTILFVAMAEIIDFSLLWQYKKEILIMFLATSLIRALMMAKFAYIANRTDKMADINTRWWSILSFAGIKGGLSIVMLMMIPSSFEHLEMFKAIVIGVILLSTFLYALALILIINKHKTAFLQECEAEKGH